MAHVLQGLGQQEVEHHGKVIPDPAHDVLGTGEDEPADVIEIHEPRRNEQHEAEVVLAAAAGPSRHLVKGRRVERHALVAVEDVRIEQDDRPRRDVPRRKGD